MGWSQHGQILPLPKPIPCMQCFCNLHGVLIIKVCVCIKVYRSTLCISYSITALFDQIVYIFRTRNITCASWCSCRMPRAVSRCSPQMWTVYFRYRANNSLQWPFFPQDAAAAATVSEMEAVECGRVHSVRSGGISNIRTPTTNDSISIESTFLWRPCALVRSALRLRRRAPLQRATATGFTRPRREEETP